MKSEIDRILGKLSDSPLGKTGLLTVHDLKDEELVALLDLSAALKKKKQASGHGDLLLGRNVAMIFEKMSTRTRCARSRISACYWIEFKPWKSVMYSCRHLQTRMQMVQQMRCISRIVICRCAPISSIGQPGNSVHAPTSASSPGCRC